MEDNLSVSKDDEGDVWTVGRLLTWTTEWLTKRGSDSPRLDAEVLLAFVRNCQGFTSTRRLMKLLMASLETTSESLFVVVVGESRWLTLLV